MKKLFWALLFCPLLIFAQERGKPAIDLQKLESWPGISPGGISKGGDYFYYSIHDDVIDPAKKSRATDRLIIQSITRGVWKKEIMGAKGAAFSEDGKYVLYKLAGDSLCRTRLGTDEVRVITAVGNYQLIKGGYLLYMERSAGKRFVVHLLADDSSNNDLVFPSVTSYELGNQGNALLLKVEDKAAGGSKQSLQYVDLNTRRSNTIWEGDALGKMAFSADDRQMAFIGRGKGDSADKIWYFMAGNDKASVLADNTSKGIGQGYLIGSRELFFNDQGNRLFFTLRLADKPVSPKADAIAVDVWNYQDVQLRTKLADVHEYVKQYPFLAVINLTPGAISNGVRRGVVQLENRDHFFLYGLYPNDIKSYSGSFLLEEEPYDTRTANHYETRLRVDSLPLIYRVSMDDGSVSRVKIDLRFSHEQVIMHFSVSKTGRWLLYYDEQKDSWYSCGIATGAIHAITRGLGASFRDDAYEEGAIDHACYPAGIAGWLKDDSFVLINSNYDIWKIDPSGKMPAMDITNGYGAKHRIRLRIYGSYDNHTQEFVTMDDGSVILSAFAMSNKYGGLFKKQIEAKRDPTLLTMGPYYGYGIGGSDGLWLVSRESTTDYRNAYLTRDFKNFERLTDLQPQRDYNWLTSEVVSWKLPDGRVAQGILYKPENFDPHKKYPLIFQFYDKETQGTYKYPRPGYELGGINVPSYVSSGYLVCLPDIYYRLGESGKSVKSTIVSAAHYLARTRPYIDSTRMAISGQSFSGWEVNYVVTHTPIFAAAFECCGMSDFVSAYGSIAHGDKYETGKYSFDNPGSYYKLNATLWQRPDLYIKNSPVFYADKVKTPLLIMHNKADPSQVTFSHGMEFFTALWQLRKHAWLLQYDRGGHGVGGVDGVDFNIRLRQFFDHYLMDKPAPRWMTEGIKPWMKGIDDGLELDVSGKQP
jgi:dipeptidyl aminopeptidase/acylaminoacyl peptidase